MEGIYRKGYLVMTGQYGVAILERKMAKKKTPRWTDDQRDRMIQVNEGRKKTMNANFRRLVNEKAIDFMELASDPAERRLALRIFREGVSRGAESYLIKVARKAGLLNFESLYDPQLFIRGELSREAINESQGSLVMSVVPAMADTPDVKTVAVKPTVQPGSMLDQMRHQILEKLERISQNDEKLVQLAKLVDAIDE